TSAYSQPRRSSTRQNGFSYLLQLDLAVKLERIIQLFCLPMGSRLLDGSLAGRLDALFDFAGLARFMLASAASSGTTAFPSGTAALPCFHPRRFDDNLTVGFFTIGFGGNPLNIGDHSVD